MDKIDAFDLKILQIIQENNKITSEVLAKEVGLSSSACQRRINSMRKAGIIQKDVSIIDRNFIGRKITIVVQVLSDKEGIEYDDEFKKTMLKAPEVMQCYYVTGDYDYVLIATFKDMEEYEIFTKKYFLNNSNIKRFSSMVVMNRVKENLSVPLN
ncbi:Lrp/AsnC family transcriptional regulator [Alphaproteobacteria bacterium]|jgi:Lrp/AsnC family leucine-responsive transcriptional regulator|nr:Lrp/AsnC family transcriptional regulator [Alphaproteobacteria bacterium]|tara:strand:- start:3876 stop:4340 length:465 start_codon:yes stop_codon:yes gene_type:complete